MFLTGTIASFLAFFVKGLTGFANTLVFSAILSFRTANRNITPIDLVLGFPSNLAIAWVERRNIRLRIVLPLCATLLLGMVPGTVLLKNGDERWIKVLLGFAIIGLAVEMLLRQRVKEPRPTSPGVLLAIGILSGFLCGLFGIGAFLVAYIGRTTKSTQELRGNICAVFLVENTARGVLYLGLGLLNLEVLCNVLLFLPGMAAGLAAGLWCAGRLPEERTRQAVIILLFVMGFSVVANNLR